MKARLTWILAAGAALALSGCIDTATRVTVKSDGSGTVEKTIVISKALVEFMEGMGTGGDAKSIRQSMLSEKSLKAEAAKMGTEVTFVSAQPVVTAAGEGYRATYAFRDINKLRLDQNPAADVSLPQAGGAARASTAELVTFRFVKGTPATLTVTTPKVQPSARSTQPQTSPQEAEAMLQALRPLYEDLRMAVTVEVQGAITETNATHVAGSTVTLMELDFGLILADEALFRKLAASQAQSVKEVQDLLKSVPGVRIETQESVTIRFR